jgi:putative nucleotidyltransferase with HDIG domain
MLDDPSVDITVVARAVSGDPALTADLLKIVNSAAYMLRSKVSNIADAVKMVGLGGLRNLLFSYGAQTILGGRESARLKELWKHSYVTAFYGYTLAKDFLRNKKIFDDVYTGGILHDMGKIIFSNVHPKLTLRIARFAKAKGIPATLLEALLAGLNHSRIGALVAKKWNFPPALVAAIRYHHEPANAPDDYRETVSSVYLADIFAGGGGLSGGYAGVDSRVLSLFNITDEALFNSVKARLAAALANEGGV